MGMGDEILVVQRDVLFKEGPFQGFVPSKLKDYLSIILSNSEYQVRSKELENNKSWQQPIPYVWLINPKTKQAFLYQRDTKGNESRLHNKYSGGVGGHIDKKELVDGEGDPIVQAMMRELREETIISEYPIPKIVGFINDDSEPVGEVHFGVVAIGETTHEVKPAEDMAHGKFYSMQEIDELFSNPTTNVEGWTRISWPFIKDYLSKL